jgi:hypothetical protein
MMLIPGRDSPTPSRDVSKHFTVLYQGNRNCGPFFALIKKNIRLGPEAGGQEGIFPRAYQGG